MFEWTLTAFGKVEKSIRSRLTNFIRAHSPDPKPTTRRIQAQWKDKSITSMVAHAYDLADVLANSGYAISSIDDGETDRTFWLKKSKAELLFRDELENEPKTDSHLALMIGVTELLERTHVDRSDALDFETFRDEFHELIQTYLKDAIDWFKSKNIIDVSSYNQQSNWRPKWKRWHNDNMDYMTPSRTTDFAQQHQDALAKLVTAMTNNQIPDDFIVYLLVPSLASSGYCWIDEDSESAGMILYLLFMPYQWIINSRDQIWELRMKEKFEDEDKFYDPTAVDEGDLARYEQEELNDLDLITKDEYAPESDDLKGKGRPPVDEQAGASTSGPTKSKKRRKERKEEKDDETPNPPPPPPPPPSSDQPTLPDDTDYIPNQHLARKVKDLTEWIKEQDEVPSTKDHLTRFSTTNYNPIPVRKIDLLSTDTKIVESANILGQMYMVTYTRSGKPIFNPVD